MKNFGISGNYPEIVDSAFAWVPTRRIALHIDAGEGYSVNWPSDSARWGNASVEYYGGEWIVPQGGVDTGKGPYSWDRILTHDGCNISIGFGSDVGCRVDNRLSLVEERIALQKMASGQKIHSSFWDLMRFGFMVNDLAKPDGIAGEANPGGHVFHGKRIFFRCFDASSREIS